MVDVIYSIVPLKYVISKKNKSGNSFLNCNGLHSFDWLQNQSKIL